MHRQGYDVQLTQYDERGWRATFYVSGMEHSATSSTASAWEQTRGAQYNARRLTLCERHQPERGALSSFRMSASCSYSNGMTTRGRSSGSSS